ncbi:mitochondrial ornithine transporter 1-like [Corticium candelabrum]|uniref:mitochondrial ornithine transporter 1-like n=1 Tax=Corticium candelabrum TaxID=121492 RepID=UPI002E267D2C|nr:mitochondrial ornithine transporter 1-like [Corticium candelabrum]
MEAHHIWDSIQHFTAGAIGGGASVAAGQPFDTVKVKMQTFPHHFRSLSQCLFVTLRREGLLRGLYAGSIPSLYANMVENAVLFLCYEQCKRVMSWVSGGDGVLQRACAGAMAAGISTIVLCPFELLKCRLQGQQQLLDRASELKAQTVRSKIGVWSMFKNIVATEGIAGLYHGLSLLMIREVPGYFLFFGGYEGSRQLLTPDGQTIEDLGPLPLFLAGGIAGVSFWLPMYPVDVVKSKSQVEGLAFPFLKTARNIIRTEGLVGLYRGLLPCLARAFPANAVLLLAYELTNKLFHHVKSS